MEIRRGRSWTRISSSKVWSEGLLFARFLTPWFQSLPYLDPALDTRDNGGTKLPHTLAVCPRQGGGSLSNTVETEIGRKVTPNLQTFLDETKSPVVQRVSTQSRSVETVDRKGLVNFNDVQIAIVGTTDVTGTKHLVQNEVGVFVSRTSGGNQHHATQEVTEGGGAGSVTGRGTLRPPALHATPARTEMTGHLASTQENGRRNKFALIVTGTRGPKRVELLGTRNITLYCSMRILRRLKKQRSHRSKS